MVRRPLSRHDFIESMLSYPPVKYNIPLLDTLGLLFIGGSAWLACRHLGRCVAPRQWPRRRRRRP